MSTTPLEANYKTLPQLFTITEPQDDTELIPMMTMSNQQQEHKSSNAPFHPKQKSSITSSQNDTTPNYFRKIIPRKYHLMHPSNRLMITRMDHLHLWIDPPSRPQKPINIGRLLLWKHTNHIVSYSI